MSDELVWGRSKLEKLPTIYRPRCYYLILTLEHRFCRENAERYSDSSSYISLMSLTYDGEIDSRIPRRIFREIDSTSIFSSVSFLDMIDIQRRWFRSGSEVGALIQVLFICPSRRCFRLSASDVVTEA